LSSGRLTPERFAIPCLVIFLLSASADDDWSLTPLSPAPRSEPRDRAELRRADE
jgi:hypothetical protein